MRKNRQLFNSFALVSKALVMRLVMCRQKVLQYTLSYMSVDPLMVGHLCCEVPMRV